MIQDELETVTNIVNLGRDKISNAIKVANPETIAIHSGRAYDMTYHTTLSDIGDYWLALIVGSRDVHLPKRTTSTTQPNVSFTRYQAGSTTIIGSLTSTGFIIRNCNKYFVDTAQAFQIGAIPAPTLGNAVIDDFDKIFGVAGTPITRAGANAEGSSEVVLHANSVFLLKITTTIASTEIVIKWRVYGAGINMADVYGG